MWVHNSMQVPDIQRRVLREVKDVNSHFFNLRTVLQPDPQGDVSTFYFTMLPNDGAMAHLPLIGRLIIPPGYPDTPPVVQLYNKTGRYNVDVYSFLIDSRDRSTLCFDVLRPVTTGGKWQPDFTLSCLFASLMAAIVSFYVPQEYGSDQPEYVSMEKLKKIKADNAATYMQYKHLVPAIPEIPLVDATEVAAIQVKFPWNPETVAVGPRHRNVTATNGPIYLQDGCSDVHTFAVDLSNLHPGVVFSVILSTDAADHAGKKPATVLCRNGVTATAARKRKNGPCRWFYHGKPMNDGSMRLQVSIGQDQFTMAYLHEGRQLVHGDCPISKLTELELGDVRGVPFYLSIFMNLKSGPDAWVTFLDTGGKGYIHGGCGDSSAPAK